MCIEHQSNLQAPECPSHEHLKIHAGDLLYGRSSCVCIHGATVLSSV